MAIADGAQDVRCYHWNKQKRQQVVSHAHKRLDKCCCTGFSDGRGCASTHKFAVVNYIRAMVNGRPCLSKLQAGACKVRLLQDLLSRRELRRHPNMACGRQDRHTAMQWTNPSQT